MEGNDEGHSSYDRDVVQGLRDRPGLERFETIPFTL